MTDRGLIERRKHSRFNVQGGTFAVFRHPWPNATALCQVVDVSLGGLGCCYVAGEQLPRGESQLEIAWGDCSSRLHGMPFKTVSDSVRINETSCDPATMRWGVQFVNLTEQQKSDLRYFIQNHSEADPES